MQLADMFWAHKGFACAALVTMICAAPSLASAQTLVAPSSATSTTDVGVNYNATQTINGGGLSGSGLAATHALVTQSGYENKFWISEAGVGLPITLTYNFSAAPTLSGVAIWNAVFQLPAVGHYTTDGAPSLFDLQVDHAGGTKNYTNVSLGLLQTSGQRFDFCENLAGVTSIRFIIRADSRLAVGIDRNVYLSEFRGMQEATPSCINPLGPDTTNPTIALNAPTNNSFGNDTTPTISGTAADERQLAAIAPVTVTVRNSLNAIVFTGTPAVGAGGAWTIDATLLPQGVYTVSAVARDAAGNSATAGPRTFTIDVTPPGVSVGAPAPNARTNDATPTVSGTAADNIGLASASPVTVEVRNAQNAVVFTGTPAVGAGGAWTVDTSALPDGTYTVRATARDLAGNSATAGPVTFVVDTVAPVVAIIAPQDGANLSDNTPLISGTSEPGATIAVTIDGSAVGSVVADGSGAWSYTAAPLADGEHTISVTARDAATNTSAPVSIDVRVDTTAPAVAITAPSNDPSTRNPTPTLSGSATDTNGSGIASLTVEVLDAGGQVVFTSSPMLGADGSWSVNTSALAEGAYTVRVTATDAAGNSASAGPNGFTIDMTAPAVALTTPADDAVLSDETPTLSGTAELGATVTITVNDATGAVAFTTTVTATGGMWSVDATALADGSYTAQATATDAASNSASTTPISFLIDTTAPVVVIVNPADGAAIADTTPSFSGTSEPDSALTLELLDDTGAVIETLTTSADATGAWSVDSALTLADGAYTVRATATDAAGNTSQPVSASFSVDATALPLAISSPAPGASLNMAPAIVGTTAPNAEVSVELLDSTGAIIETLTVTADATGAWSATPTMALGDGDYTVNASVQNSAGVQSDASTSFSLDSAAPAITLDAPAPDAITSSPQPAISGTAEAGAAISVELKDSTGAIVETLTTSADAMGNWTVSPSAALADGDYTVTATASDAAGNSATAGPNSFSVDSSAPAVSITAPMAGDEVIDATPTITGTAEPGATVTLLIDGQPAGMATADANGNWSFDAPALSVGTHTVEATSTDEAGNTGSSGEVSFEVGEEQMGATVTITSPTQGGSVTGPSVTVTGTGEPGATITVTLGEESKTVVVGQDGSWSVTFDDVPAGSTSIEADDGSSSVSIDVTVNDPAVEPQPDSDLVLAGGCSHSSAQPASSLWLLAFAAFGFLRRKRRA